MEILTVGVVGAAVASSFLYAIWPLVRPPEGAEDLLAGANGRETREQEVSRLLMERDQAYKGIVDLEFDRQMGKLSDEDFAQMMASARAHALAVLRRLEARGVEEGAVPVQLSEREAGREAGRLAEAAPETEEEEAEDAAEPALDERLEEEILAYRAVKPPEAAPAPKPAPRPKPAAASPAAQAPGAVRFCPSCGAKAGEGHNFCAACGFKLR
ncbi:MAG: hypothetical protein A3J27_02910 [Candidatus Tectomicrobia bacterium RIFCSPLOWO2_12_FULL_69_37]|nr:MAG: hypothetical protein A3J27_02910 [Candidatus Tectomicrobia bacterium RIFCSPLOWO2_12_FULL_69_37]